jgi:hypothetical protein
LIASVGLLLSAPLMLLLPLFLCLVTILLRRLLCLLRGLLLPWMDRSLRRDLRRIRGHAVRRLMGHRALCFRVPGGRRGYRLAFRRRVAALRTRSSIGTVERHEDAIPRRPRKGLGRRHEEGKTKGESPDADRFHTHLFPATTT